MYQHILNLINADCKKSCYWYKMIFLSTQSWDLVNRSILGAYVHIDIQHWCESFRLKKHRLNLRIHHRGALSWSRVGASIHSLSPRCLPLQFLLMIQEQIVVARKSSVPTPAARKQMDFAAGQAFYILPHNFSTRWKYILYSLFTKRIDKSDVAGTLIRRIRL